MAGARSRGSSGPFLENSTSEPGARIYDVLPRPKAPRISGARMVMALLPSGRTAWLHLRPAVATVSEVNRLARSVAAAEARRVLINRADALEIERLDREAASDARRLVRERQAVEHETRKLLAERDAKVDGSITSASTRTRAGENKSWRRLGRADLKARRRNLWDALVLASAAPLFAAYGQQGDPLAVDNVTLALSLLVWLVGDEISDFLTGETSIPGGLLRDVDVWSYAAPFANVLTGWWLLGDSQHERFVSGVTTAFEVLSPRIAEAPARERYVARVDLTRVVAPDYAPELASLPQVPTFAAITAATRNPAIGGKIEIGSVTTFVRAGELTIEVVATTPAAVVPGEPFLTNLQVAWVVDSQEASS